MSTAGCMLTEEELLCAICLDIYTLPVTLPCGHNYCRACITTQWEMNSQCQCPLCKESFDSRPSLRINNSISEMAQRFKQTTAMKPRNSIAGFINIRENNNPRTTANDISGLINKFNRIGILFNSSRSPISNISHMSSNISDSGGERNSISTNSISTNSISTNSSSTNSSSTNSSSTNSIGRVINDLDRGSSSNISAVNSCADSINRRINFRDISSDSSGFDSSSNISISTNSIGRVINDLDRGFDSSSNISAVNSCADSINRRINFRDISSDSSGFDSSSNISISTNSIGRVINDLDRGFDSSSNISAVNSCADSINKRINFRDISSVSSGFDSSSNISISTNSIGRVINDLDRGFDSSSNISAVNSCADSINRRINFRDISSVSSSFDSSSNISNIRSGFDSSSNISISRKSISDVSELQRQVAGLGDVPCDECNGVVLKAVKSCLQCLTSYCQTHVRPHQTTMILKVHTLLEPMENLGARMCPKHKNPLEFFCRTDSKIICMHCKVLDHERHQCVHLEEESTHRKGMLGMTHVKLQQMIQDRREKIQHLRRAAHLNEETAGEQKAVGNRRFSHLQDFLKRGLEELVQSAEENLGLTLHLNESLIKEVSHEISDLTQKSADVQQLSSSNDYFHVVQSFSAISNIPPMKDWSEVRVQQPLYERMAREAMMEAVDKLMDTFRNQKKKLLKAELSRAQKYEVDVVLDPETASPWLDLSDNCRQARLTDMKKHLTNTSMRFYPQGGILAKQAFHSGRFYFEVQFQDLVRWDLGVVKESINRKEKVSRSQEAGHWILSLRKGSELRARCSHDIQLSEAWNPQRVGVFVDYDQGLVTFYDLVASELIYAFNDCCFTEKLYPFFNPGQASTNSGKLIICQTQYL